METSIDVALNGWFSNQTKWNSRADFARAFGINEKTLSDYFNGRYEPTPKNRKKLFEATGLEYFKPIGTEEASLVEPVITKSESQEVPLSEVGRQLASIGKEIIQLGELLTRSATSDVVAHVQAVEDSIYALNDELTFFKEGPAHSRRILRQRLSGPDVGYITTLLRAIFNEEKFQDWLAMTTYEMRR